MRFVPCLAPQCASVNIIFAVVASAVADLRGNAQERRKQQRQDQRDKRHLVVTKRVKLPLTRWEALLSSIGTSLNVPVHAAPCKLILVCDPSPWVVGAVLAHVSGAPIEYFASEVTALDATLLALELGSSSSQSVLEALCVLVALRRWGKHCSRMHTAMQVRTDNLATVFTLQKLAARSPRMNFRAAETAIHLECLQVASWEMRRIPGELNVTADALSRCSAPSA
eukprot:2994939-Amphidinium_carterae.1